MGVARIFIMRTSAIDKESELERLLEELEEHLSKQPGYSMGFRFVGHQDEGEQGRMALWSVTPNPPKDTDGRREDSGRVGEGAIGEMAGLHWGRLEVGGRSSVAA